MYLFTLLLLSCYVGIALAKTEAEVKQWFMGQGALCLSEHPVTDEELMQMHNHTVPDSSGAKCFISCIFKKTEWMDADGMFSEENAVKTVEQDHSGDPTKIENAKKLIAVCKKVNDETFGGAGADAHCERGASLANCLIENAPKMGFKLP